MYHQFSFVLVIGNQSNILQKGNAVDIWKDNGYNNLCTGHQRLGGIFGEYSYSLTVPFICVRIPGFVNLGAFGRVDKFCVWVDNNIQIWIRCFDEV